MNRGNDEFKTAAAKRERLAYQYAQALSRSDYDAIDRILALAETDKELESVLWSVSESFGDALLGSEEQIEAQERAALIVAEAAHHHFGTENVHTNRAAATAALAKIASDARNSFTINTAHEALSDDEPPAPVTVGEVISRLRRTSSLMTGAGRPESKWLTYLDGNETPIGNDVSERTLTTLLGRLNVVIDNANRSFVTAFQKTAALLTMSRQAETMRFAAAREQRRKKAPAAPEAAAANVAENNENANL